MCSTRHLFSELMWREWCRRNLVALHAKIASYRHYMLLYTLNDNSGPHLKRPSREHGSLHYNGRSMFTRVAWSKALRDKCIILSNARLLVVCGAGEAIELESGVERLDCVRGGFGYGVITYRNGVISHYHHIGLSIKIGRESPVVGRRVLDTTVTGDQTLDDKLVTDEELAYEFDPNLFDRRLSSGLLLADEIRQVVSIYSVGHNDRYKLVYINHSNQLIYYKPRDNSSRLVARGSTRR